jgi:hypothetical protein
MIFLALKIIRFLFGLVLKVLLLPVKLVKLAMGAQSGDDEYETYDPDDTLSEDTSTSDGRAGSSSLADSDLFDVDAATAARNLVWFRWGLFGIGALQLVISLFMLVEIASAPGGSWIIAPVAIVAVMASLPIAAAVLLPRKPTAGWYLGMGLTALLIVGSVSSGFLTLVVGAPLAYLGYTGRPAVGVVYAERSRAETQTSTETDATAVAEPATETDPVESEDVNVSGQTEPSESADPTGSAVSSADRTVEASTDLEPEDGTEPTPYAESAAQATDSEPDSEPETDSGSDSSSEPETTVDSDGTLDRYRGELTADDPTVRADAVRGLAAAVESESAPDQAVVDAISERLDDDDAAVRSAACEALGSLGASRAEPRLRDCRIDPDPEVSRAASRALRNLE